MADDAEDPWGFLAKRPSARADSSSDATSPSDVTGSSDVTSPSDVTGSSDVTSPSDVTGSSVRTGSSAPR